MMGKQNDAIVLIILHPCNNFANIYYYGTYGKPMFIRSYACFCVVWYIYMLFTMNKNVMLALQPLK